MKKKNLLKKEVKQILKILGEELKSFEILNTKESFCNTCIFVNNYVFKKVNKKWKDKAEAEVYAMKLARKLRIPAPKIVYWNKDYIVYKKAKGRPLTEIWCSLKQKQKRRFMRQIIKYVKRMQKVKFDKIGSLSSKGITKDIDIQKGPYTNFKEFLMDDLEHNVQKLKKSERELFKDSDKIIKRYSSKNNFVFTHKDLERKNLIVENGKIKGVIDWEWGGSYPPIYDYNELSNWCDKDLLEKIEPEKEDKKLTKIIRIIKSAMCLANYKDWKLKDEDEFLLKLKKEIRDL